MQSSELGIKTPLREALVSQYEKDVSFFCGPPGPNGEDRAFFEVKDTDKRLWLSLPHLADEAKRVLPKHLKTGRRPLDLRAARFSSSHAEFEYPLIDGLHVVAVNVKSAVIAYLGIRLPSGEVATIQDQSISKPLGRNFVKVMKEIAGVLEPLMTI